MKNCANTFETVSAGPSADASTAAEAMADKSARRPYLENQMRLPWLQSP